jgi:hypothetical protein
MISSTTARDVEATVSEWASVNGVTDDAVLDLLERLSKIDGNKSFRDTTSALVRLWRVRA